MSKYYFSDSTVEKFVTEHGTAILVLSDVRYEDALVKLSITVDEYTFLQENDGTEGCEFISVSKLEMPTPTGEALSFSSSDDGFEALIQWDSFKPRKSFTRSYNVRGKSVVVDMSTPYTDKR